jgi:hypothetical protein
VEGLDLAVFADGARAKGLGDHVRMILRVSGRVALGGFRFLFADQPDRTVGIYQVSGFPLRRHSCLAIESACPHVPASRRQARTL